MLERSHQPHSVSLKVLRLSRPTLAQQHALPRNNPTVSQHFSLLAPKDAPVSDFVLTSLLTLPQSFGAVYVGETFACSLCANNELTPTSDRAVSNIRLTAEVQTPSQSLPLDFDAPPDSKASTHDDSTIPSSPGSTIQKIVRFDLKEEGKHVLAVNVSYSETTTTTPSPPITEETGKSSDRTRSFRKLYQFEAQPCLGIRTKATELDSQQSKTNPSDINHRGLLRRYVLEAQLENLNEGTIVVESAVLSPRPPFKSTSLNWDNMPVLPILDKMTEKGSQAPVMKPGDILQVAFLIEQQDGMDEGLEEGDSSLRGGDGRAALGQMTVRWRSGMGEPGELSTGLLMSRKR